MNGVRTLNLLNLVENKIPAKLFIYSHLININSIGKVLPSKAKKKQEKNRRTMMMKLKKFRIKLKSWIALKDLWGWSPLLTKKILGKWLKCLIVDLNQLGPNNSAFPEFEDLNNKSRNMNVELNKAMSIQVKWQVVFNHKFHLKAVMIASMLIANRKVSTRFQFLNLSSYLKKIQKGN